MLLIGLSVLGYESIFGSTPSLSGAPKKPGNFPTGNANGANRQDLVTGRAPDKPHIPVTVTSGDASLPNGCTPEQVSRVMADFVEGVNQGDGQKISNSLELTSRPGPGGVTPFSWYSVTVDNPQRGGEKFVTYDQNELLSYLKKRHDRGEQLNLLMVAVIGKGENGVVGADVALTRTTDNLNSGSQGAEQLARVKSVVQCDTRKIIRWVMTIQETNERVPDLRICPEVPRNWKPGASVIACVR